MAGRGERERRRPIFMHEYCHMVRTCHVVASTMCYVHHVLRLIIVIYFNECHVPCASQRVRALAVGVAVGTNM